jgi:hypothetical protein
MTKRATAIIDVAKFRCKDTVLKPALLYIRTGHFIVTAIAGVRLMT